MLPNLRLDDLEVAIKVIECRHITRAAAKLNKHQTTVTKCMQRVEQSIGVPLLDRSVHPVRPTRAGGVLSYWGRKGLDALARGLAEAQRVDRRSSAVVHIGYTSYFNLEMLADIKKLTAGQRAPFSCRFHSSSTAEVIAMVRGGRWDCGLILSPAPSDDLNNVPLYREPLGLLVARDHPLAERRTVRVADLGGMPLIVPAQEPNTGFRSWLMERCGAEGVALRIVHEVDNPQEAWHLVSQNEGVAVMLRSAAQSLRRTSTVFRRFLEEDLAGQIQIVFRDEPQTRTLAAVVTMLLEQHQRMQSRQSRKPVVPMPVEEPA